MVFKGKSPAGRHFWYKWGFAVSMVMFAVSCTSGPEVAVQMQTACNCDSGIATAPVNRLTPLSASLPQTRASSVSLRTGDERSVKRLEPVHALRLINDYRLSNGLRRVIYDADLTVIARAHAKDLAQQDLVSHTGSDGASLAKRLERGGYDPLRATENISAGQRNFEEAFAAWQQSKPHRNKLLTEEVSEIGIAYVYDPTTEYRTFWIMIMAEPF